ncbi:hypothetical protein CYMTET_4598 [Cymbomonas tetramitiformis]|uniref:Uncharacterized protein n=1 Tax=Cymbomonas tetramitiformis TaxID=36881 RepID=A0AAE0H0X2_9CHLO|nr:hypothetical protein CYMTET_4598 [Cymbomonas tetramitiformis]
MELLVLLRVTLREHYWQRGSTVGELGTEYMMLWKFMGLVFLHLCAKRPRWWARQFLPYWGNLTAEELTKWYEGQDKYSVYVLISPWTSRSYVGKAWSGTYYRCQGHLQVAADTELWGAKKLYSWLRSYGIFNYVYLPLAVFSGKRDCNAGEKILIRSTQHHATTLNTKGVRPKGVTAARRRRSQRVRNERPRRRMAERAAGARRRRCLTRNCSGKSFSVVKSGEYVGSDLRVWLQARATDEEVENVVDVKPGLLESTSWKVVKLLFGHNKVSATVHDEEGETSLAGKLRDVLNDVKRRAVVLKFEKGVTAVWDVWASEVVKKLVRTPEATVELYRCSLMQLVRIFEAVRAGLPWKDRAKVRRHIALAAKKVHNFTLKGVYPLKLPPADAWKSYGVRKVTEEMVKDLHVPKMVENFVRRRTMPVMTSAVKLRDFFCNFKELTLLKKRPECLCHMASEDFPRVDGHVCARTTRLRSGPLAVLNRNLKDTPVMKVNFGESMEKAFTEYAVQFAGAASRVQDEAVLQLLPVTLTVDDRRLCMWHTVTRTTGVLQHWVELRDENVKLIFRVKFERFNRLLLRLVVWGEVEEKSTLLELCEAVAKRMLFWVERITRDYWITPYPDQDVLRETLALTDEMFATPFDMNVNAAAFFTPYQEDSIFGAGVDTYAHWWFTMGLANPIYTLERIVQTLEHAVNSAKMAKVPMRIVVICPAWRNWAAMEGVCRLMQFARHRFKFMAPQSALGYVDKSTGARFDVDVLLIQNTKAARKFPVTDAHLDKFRKHFKGRLSVDPEYSEDWHIQYDENFRRTRLRNPGVVEMPKKLRELKDTLKGTAALRWKQKVKMEKWRRDHGVPEGPVTVDERVGVTDAGEYCRMLERYCAGTARLYLDRNAGVGAMICQQRYFDLLVNERVSSAAQFEEVRMTPAELVRDLEVKFNRAMLGTVTKFVKTGVFGATYALLKDKDDELQKYRPVQPNNRAPLAPLQNVAGRAIEFVVQEAGGSMTLGGTQRLKHAVEKFNAVSKAARGVYAYTFDVKDQFSNLEHKMTEKAIHAMVSVAFDKAGETSLLVTVRGAKGVQWYKKGVPRVTAVRVTRSKLVRALILSLRHNYVWIAGKLVRQTRGVGMGGRDSPGTASCVCAYGEREFTMSLGADNLFIHFWRQADDAIALVWTLTGTRREWKRLRSTLRGYRDDCYAHGMRVLMTGAAGSDEELPDAVEYCGMEVRVMDKRVTFRQLMQNEKRGCMAMEDPVKAFPFVHWLSACPESRKAATLVSVLSRLRAHSTDFRLPETLLHLWRELHRQGYPEGWLSRGLTYMSSKDPVGFWGQLRTKLFWESRPL